jgi:hypothetical protein
MLLLSGAARDDPFVVFVLSTAADGTRTRDVAPSTMRYWLPTIAATFAPMSAASVASSSSFALVDFGVLQRSVRTCCAVALNLQNSSGSRMRWQLCEILFLRQLIDDGEGVEVSGVELTVNGRAFVETSRTWRVHCFRRRRRQQQWNPTHLIPFRTLTHHARHV